MRRRARARARDGHRGRRPRRRLHRRAARRARSPTSSRARAWSASSPTTRSASSSRARPRTPPRWPRAPPRRQGLNAAGAAAGHIFLEVWRYAEQQGARPESMIGLAGTGDLVGTALAPAEPQPPGRRAARARASRRRRSPSRIGQAVEALDLVPLLANALDRAGVEAPVTNALNRLIAGELPLDDWVAQVRATVPPPARFGSARGVGALAPADEGALRAQPRLAPSALLIAITETSLRELCQSAPSMACHDVSPTSSSCCSAPSRSASSSPCSRSPARSPRRWSARPSRPPRQRRPPHAGAAGPLPTSVADIYARVSRQRRLRLRPRRQRPAPFNGQGGGRAASGSGFVIDTDGHIVTNDHVVEDADAVHASASARTATRSPPSSSARTRRPTSPC